MGLGEPERKPRTGPVPVLHRRRHLTADQPWLERSRRRDDLRPVDDATAARRAARHAEDLGFDHVAIGNRLLDSGLGLDADPLVLLSAVSAATRHLRLLTSVLVAPYYPPLVLANQAATVDVISGGRLILGIGTG